MQRGNDLQVRFRATTPYGTVLQHLELELDGRPYRWPCLYPFALLHHLCTLSVAFAHIITGALRGRPGHLIVYADEFTPGNPFRPDEGRKVWAVYWTMREWPEFLRHSVLGWLSFGFIRTKLVNKIAGGISHLLKLVLRSFFCGDFSLGTGVRCPVGDGFVLVQGRALLKANRIVEARFASPLSKLPPRFPTSQNGSGGICEAPLGEDVILV